MSKVEVEEDYYSNGKLSWRVERLNGKRHGVYERWYSNGQVKWKSSWSNSNIYGLSEWWIEDGKLRSREFDMI